MSSILCSLSQSFGKTAASQGSQKNVPVAQITMNSCELPNRPIWMTCKEKIWDVPTSLFRKGSPKNKSERLKKCTKSLKGNTRRNGYGAIWKLCHQHNRNSGFLVTLRRFDFISSNRCSASREVTLYLYQWLPWVIYWNLSSNEEEKKKN